LSSQFSSRERERARERERERGREREGDKRDETTIDGYLRR